MSITRETGDFTTINATMTTSFKLVFLLSLLASTSVVFVSVFRNQTHWQKPFPEKLATETRPASAPETRPDMPPEAEHEHQHATDISHLAFGIAGSIATWQNRRHYSELWWDRKTMRGYVWLDGRPDPNVTWAETSPPYRVSDPLPDRLRKTDRASAVRIARIVIEMFRAGLPDVRWFVMGDDDTVFFAENLVSALNKYDHRKMYYIGGNSESVEQDLVHSYGMAFGGGGFAVSYPLAKELEKGFDRCLERYGNFYGSDQRVWACVKEIGVPLTVERGFHQIDIRGDPYGLLAAHPMAPLVSLHHLDYVKPLFPNQTQLESLRSLFQAYRVDPSRTMQQCFCYYKSWMQQWSVSISWGYTVQIYPTLFTANELETPLQTFQTWRSWRDGPFTFNTRPVSPDPCQSPVIFFLESVQETGNVALTTYSRYDSATEKKCGIGDLRRTVQRVSVSVSKMDPQEWSEGPRRHCCDVNSVRFGRMKVAIRSCKGGETITS